MLAAISIILGNVIGTGVFLKARVMTCNVGDPTWVIIAWVAAGILSLAGALQISSHIENSRRARMRHAKKHIRRPLPVSSPTARHKSTRRQAIKYQPPALNYSSRHNPTTHRASPRRSQPQNSFRQFRIWQIRQRFHKRHLNLPWRNARNFRPPEEKLRSR